MIRFALRPFSLGISLVLLGWLLSAYQPGQAQLVGAATPSGATFPMGVDVTGQLAQIAGPEGQAAVEDLASLNVTWVRMEFKATDPTNLKAYDLAVSRLQSRGLRIMAVLVAPWLSCELDDRQKDLAVFTGWVREVYLNGCGKNSPASTHQLGFNELTARYPSIQYWQVWNEPNVCGFLGKDLDDCGYGLWRRDEIGGERVNVRYGMQKFGALIATVYAERANKSVKIVTGGILNAYNCSAELDPTCNTAPDDCYKLLPWASFSCDAGTNLFINSDAVQTYKRDHAGKLPFDILGLHPYEPAAWANGYLPPSLYVTRDIERGVRRFVDRAYPIWITEWGFNLGGLNGQLPVCRFPVGSIAGTGCEENAGKLLDSLVDGLNLRTDLNITNMFWFNLADGEDILQTGLLDANQRKRAAWFHFQAAAKALGQPAQQSYQKEYLQGQAAVPNRPVAPADQTPPPIALSPLASPAASSRRDFMQQLYDTITLALK